MNKVILMGRLTRDPELKTTPTGATVAKFSVVTNKKWKDESGQMQEKAEFHNIVAWRKLAETVGQYCKKGNRVLLEGELETRNWEGEDKIKRYATEVIARTVNIIDFPPKDEAQNEQNNENQDEVKVENVPF